MNKAKLSNSAKFLLPFSAVFVERSSFKDQLNQDKQPKSTPKTLFQRTLDINEYSKNQR